MPNYAKLGAAAFGVLAAAVIAVVVCIEVVPAGHVQVATLLGKIRPQPYEAGLHVVNPLLSFHQFDVRQDTQKMSQVPIYTADQLTSLIDVSINYRFIPEMTPHVLGKTGDPARAINVLMEPRLRSLIREQGKSVARAEEFFDEKTQQRMQADLTAELRDALSSEGIEVLDVLVRALELPQFILQAIEQKKEREQAVEKERAELERVKTQAQQQVAEAEAKKAAAEFHAEQIKVLADAEAEKLKRLAAADAEKVRLLADAEAHKIRAINEAIGDSPAYLKVRAMETLAEMGRDPAAKLYFVPSDGPWPVPLMHLGEGMPAAAVRPQAPN